MATSNAHSNAWARRLRVHWLTLLALCAGGCGRAPETPATSPASAPAGPRPNIVFILMDTLRADRLGVYGAPHELSPNIDALAAEGVLFEQTVAAAPWTQPSIASLFSGQYPGVHQVIDYGKAIAGTIGARKKVPVFHEESETLAEALHAAGYETAAFSANPFIVGEFGFAQGFDHFDSSFARNTTRGAVVNEAVTAWLRQRTSTKPLFLYIHYMDVHGPYDERPPYLKPLLDAVEALPNKRRLTPDEVRRLDYLRATPRAAEDLQQHARLAPYWEYWAARYEAGVRWADQSVHELRSTLEEMGVWQEALVIFTADHGEALCEHGHWDHGLSVHEPELHVPLMVRWPGKLPAGRRVSSLSRLIDVGPTLLDLLHLPPIAGAQGASLAAELRGTDTQAASAPGPRVAFAECVKAGPEQRAIYLGDWKFIQALEGDAMLYNIRDDPLEQRNLLGGRPEEEKALRELLARQLADNAQRRDGRAPAAAPASEELLQRLKALGYVGD